MTTSGPSAIALVLSALCLLAAAIGTLQFALRAKFTAATGVPNPFGWSTAIEVSPWMRF